MSDTDLIKLYSSRILELAASIPLDIRLSAPDATAMKRSPLCGSAVTVDVVVRNGAIVEFGHDVKACALGQAAASVVASNIIGRTRAQIDLARSELNTMLKADGPAPSAPFDELQVLVPARAFANRHASIMLSLDATSQAMVDAENSVKATG